MSYGVEVVPARVAVTNELKWLIPEYFEKLKPKEEHQLSQNAAKSNQK